MRFKMAQSEADGLFMKANRKHEILLNFELKRIAVEKKMRERYFNFEKSLMVAHQSKIIARQKALGIYRPKTTPDKKRTATNSFFIANVSMETKGRAKLPPLKEARRRAKPPCDKKASGSVSARANSTRNLFTIHHSSSPDLKQGWSLTEVADSTESLADKCLDSKIIESIDSVDNAPFGIQNATRVAGSDVQDQKDDASSTAHNGESLSEQKTIQNVSEKRPSSGKDTICNAKSHGDTHNSRDATEKTSIDSQQVASVEESDAEKDTGKTQKSTQVENMHQNNNNKSSMGDSEDRPKSARSLENGLEGVQAGILNLNLRAQSAGVKTK